MYDDVGDPDQSADKSEEPYRGVTSAVWKPDFSLYTLAEARAGTAPVTLARVCLGRECVDLSAFAPILT